MCQCFNVSLYYISVFQCFNVSIFQCFSLLHFNVPMFQCFNVSMFLLTTFQCFNVTGGGDCGNSHHHIESARSSQKRRTQRPCHSCVRSFVCLFWECPPLLRRASECPRQQAPSPPGDFVQPIFDEGEARAARVSYGLPAFPCFRPGLAEERSRAAADSRKRIYLQFGRLTTAILLRSLDPI